MDEAAPLPSGLSALNEDERREYWAALALRHIRGLGVRAACTLLKHFGSAYEAVMNVPRWPEAGVPAQKAEGISATHGGPRQGRNGNPPAG